MSVKREAKVVQFHQCLCGCGNTTRREFAPGHDNRYFGQVIRGERDAQDLEAFPGLARKWQNRQAKALAVEVPVADPFAGVNGEHIASQPSPTKIILDSTEVKDGRWWYRVRGIAIVGDDLFEVDWVAKNGGLRTTRVTADKLR